MVFVCARKFYIFFFVFFDTHKNSLCEALIFFPYDKAYYFLKKKKMDKCVWNPCGEVDSSGVDECSRSTRMRTIRQQVDNQPFYRRRLPMSCPPLVVLPPPKSKTASHAPILRTTPSGDLSLKMVAFLLGLAPYLPIRTLVPRPYLPDHWPEYTIPYRPYGRERLEERKKNSVVVGVQAYRKRRSHGSLVFDMRLTWTETEDRVVTVLKRIGADVKARQLQTGYQVLMVNDEFDSKESVLTRLVPSLPEMAQKALYTRARASPLSSLLLSPSSIGSPTITTPPITTPPTTNASTTTSPDPATPLNPRNVTVTSWCTVHLPRISHVLPEWITLFPRCFSWLNHWMFALSDIHSLPS